MAKDLTEIRAGFKPSPFKVNDRPDPVNIALQYCGSNQGRSGRAAVVPDPMLLTQNPPSPLSFDHLGGGNLQRERGEAERLVAREGW